MKEIKFRGKTPEGKWVYGSYINRNQNDYMYDVIINNKYRGKAVIPKTVGQYTGKKDKSGKEIYDGDLVEFATFQQPEFTKKAICKYNNSDGCWYFVTEFGGMIEFIEVDFDTVKKIGNKYKNSNLLNINLEEE